MQLLYLLVASSILVPAPMTKQEGWTGQIVMLKRSGITYRNASKPDGSGSLMMIEYRVIQDKGEELVVIENGKDVIVRKDDMVPQMDAIVFYTEALQKDPTDVTALAFRGWAYRQKKSLDKALEDYGKCIELSPQQCAWRNNRALIWIEKKDYDKAIADYDESIRLLPNYGLAFRNRGNCWLKKKEYAKALQDFEKSVALSPDSPSAYNALAHLLATCPDKKFRDGDKALEAAKKANDLSGSKSGSILDTVAAAHAELGQFDDAIKYQERAFADPFYAKEKEKAEEARKRLQLYREKKPYREVPN